MALLKREALKAAEKAASGYMILDGAPGIGCPVMASLAGVDAAVIVSEPTVSGHQDFIRLADLLKMQGIRAFLLVNKWDLNPDETERLERTASGYGFAPLGRVPFDPGVVKALLARKTVVESGHGPAAAVKDAWLSLTSALGR